MSQSRRKLLARDGARKNEKSGRKARSSVVDPGIDQKRIDTPKSKPSVSFDSFET